MNKYLSYFILGIGLYTQTACLENTAETTSCYSTKVSTRKVFTEMINKPHFKGGHDSLASFLSTNINFEKFVNSHSPNGRIYNDTARIKFVVRRQGGLSDLSVKVSNSTEFAQEVTRVIKQSSCNWIAGGKKQRISGWHQFDIYFSVNQPSEKEVKTIMTINEL